MKRLFAIRDSRGHLVCGSDNKPMYFADKPSAREYRKTLTQDHHTYFITFGVDHRSFKG
jgi:hypothetical protein